MQKFYCYVDETGQDTKGDLFIVSVVVTEDEQEEIIEQLEGIEQDTGKGRVKWMKTKHTARLAYIRQVLALPALKGKLSYAVHHHTTDYITRTVLTTARAITVHARGDYQATILIDALPKSHVRWVGKELRHLHIRTKKVRGVRKEEASALMRLADALCGFTRGALSGSRELMELLKQAKEDGFIREL